MSSDLLIIVEKVSICHIGGIKTDFGFGSAISVPSSFIELEKLPTEDRLKNGRGVSDRHCFPTQG